MKQTSHVSNNSPSLKLIVVNTVSISEDKEVVLLITLAGFVLDIPVIFPCNLVIIPKNQKSIKQSIILTRWSSGVEKKAKKSFLITLLQAYNPRPHHSLSCACEVFLHLEGSRPQTDFLPHPSFLCYEKKWEVNLWSSTVVHVLTQ